MNNLFPVLSEEEAQRERFSLLPNGEYDFVVRGAEYKLSAAGNPMIKLKLSVWDKDGAERTVYDHLMGTTKMAYKVRHFCKAVGLIDEYERGEFNKSIAEGRSDFLLNGKHGRARIGFKAGNEKPDGGKYHDSNCVEDYLYEGQGQPKQQEAKKVEPLNDDIPF